VGQTPTPEDSNDGLTLLQSLMAQWQRRRWLVWSLVDTSVISNGALSYTVGTGGDFNIPRPDRIDSAFARLLPPLGVETAGFDGGLVLLPANSPLPTSPDGLPPGTYWNDGGILAQVPGGSPLNSPQFIDFPMAIITAREEYNRIAVKGLSVFPSAVFYDGAFPSGNLFWWPVPPQGQFELHITTKSVLPPFANLTDPLDALPPEYLEALIWSMCVRLQMTYGDPVNPAHVAAMNAALSVLRMANMQIPEAFVPTFGRRGSGGMAAGSSPGFQTGGIW
jgi:hypothetical protein